MDTFEVPDWTSVVSVFRHIDESRFAGRRARRMLPAPSGLYANSSCVRRRDGLEAFYTTLHKGFLIHSPPAQDDFHPKEHELHPE